MDVSPGIIVSTPRLVLRRWQPSDRNPFAAMNADPRVMEYFPRPFTVEESHQAIDRIEAGFEQRGFGLCAVELQADHSFIGFIGLSVPNFTAHFTPCIEIGWRLAARAWGNGYASEGAKAIAAHAFETLKLDQIVSFTAEQNLRSRRVMEKLGMTFNPDDSFDHPNFPLGHLLRRHVLYRLRAQEFGQPVK